MSAGSGADGGRSGGSGPTDPGAGSQEPAAAASRAAGIGGQIDRGARQFGPLILLGLLAVVIVEPLLGEHNWLARTFGPDIGLRCAVVGLCVYVAVLLLERRQMSQLFREVLLELRRLRGSDAGATGGPGGGRHGAAVDILVQALDSDDAEVKANARTHLVRLTGMDLGEDPDAWRRALAEHRPDV